VSYERKYDTQKSNENYAKKIRPCRLPFPQTWNLNSLLVIFPISFTRLAQFNSKPVRIHSSFKPFSVEESFLWDMRIIIYKRIIINKNITSIECQHRSLFAQSSMFWISKKKLKSSVSIFKFRKDKQRHAVIHAVCKSFDNCNTVIFLFYFYYFIKLSLVMQ
jgi:hypothetical protein